jgi:hypothetical protein
MKGNMRNAASGVWIRVVFAAAIGSAFAFFSFLPLFRWARSSSTFVLKVLEWLGPLPQFLIPNAGDVALTPPIPTSFYVWLAVRTAFRTTLFVLVLSYLPSTVARATRHLARLIRRSGPDWPALIAWSVLGVVGGAITGVFAAAYSRRASSLLFAAALGALILGSALPVLRGLVQVVAAPRGGNEAR